ncbi:MAG: hypothetical protein HY067_10060 [Betaproteobacteria bacterium]|nr:hypothetical protein [Betaproteobacteria bacterium]
MAKARVTTKGGATITVEGTPDEVATLVARLESGSQPARKRATPSGRKSKLRTTPTGLIVDLIDGGFFKKPKELSAIRLALEEQGHYYPVTTLSPILLRFIRKRELRRIKDQKRWLYVN